MSLLPPSTSRPSERSRAFPRPVVWQRPAPRPQLPPPRCPGADSCLHHPRTRPRQMRSRWQSATARLPRPPMLRQQEKSDGHWVALGRSVPKNSRDVAGVQGGGGGLKWIWAQVFAWVLSRWTERRDHDTLHEKHSESRARCTGPDSATHRGRSTRIQEVGQKRQEIQTKNHNTKRMAVSYFSEGSGRGSPPPKNRRVWPTNCSAPRPSSLCIYRGGLPTSIG